AGLRVEERGGSRIGGPARPEGDRGLPRQRGGERGSPAAAPGTVLEVEGIHTFYGTIHALKGISLTVYEGEIVTLIGSNGAGKSTTLRSVNGLIHRRRGKIRCRGERLTSTPPHKIAAVG